MRRYFVSSLSNAFPRRLMYSVTSGVTSTIWPLRRSVIRRSPEYIMASWRSRCARPSAIHLRKDVASLLFIKRIQVCTREHSATEVQQRPAATSQRYKEHSAREVPIGDAWEAQCSTVSIVLLAPSGEFERFKEGNE